MASVFASMARSRLRSKRCLLTVVVSFFRTFEKFEEIVEEIGQNMEGMTVTCTWSAEGPTLLAFLLLLPVF